jgi:hypothetical protein
MKKKAKVFKNYPDWMKVAIIFKNNKKMAKSQELKLLT